MSNCLYVGIVKQMLIEFTGKYVLCFNSLAQGKIHSGMKNKMIENIWENLYGFAILKITLDVSWNPP